MGTANEEIAMEEVKKALNKVKIGKAFAIDNNVQLQIKVLRQEEKNTCTGLFKNMEYTSNMR